VSLGVLLARYSRTVVGWARSQRVDATLVQEALPMAWGRRQGDCLDNAAAERLCGSLKGERTSPRHDARRQEA
jgi:transposase InsO family protein